MLHAGVYAGRISGLLTDRQTVKAAFDPLVPPALFDKVQLVLSGQGHVPSPHNCRNPAFALRGLVRCGRCGKMLTASNATGRHGKRYGYYTCWHRPCHAVNVRKETMEQDFIRLLTDIRIETSPLLQRFRDHILNEWQLRHAEVIAAQGQLAARGTELAKQQTALLDKMLRGVVDEATYKAKNTELTHQITLARAQVQEAAGDEFDLETAINLACLMIQNTARLWWESSLEHRQRLQGALFPNGLTYDPETGLGTAVTRWPVREMKEIATPRNKMAPPRGVEPLLPG
jgi:site-specific DNA recombinase